MPFVAVPQASIPKSAGRGRSFDLETATALLEIIRDNPDSGVSDGETYASREDATKAAATNRRLLARVTPEGKMPQQKVYADNRTGEFLWALFLVDFKARKPRTTKNSTPETTEDEPEPFAAPETLTPPDAIPTAPSRKR